MKHRELIGWVTRRLLPLALGVAVAAGLAACGGGGGGGSVASPAPGPGSSATVMSSGVITAFGSVFVNGHRFNTDNAVVIDDDTGERGRGANGLEVGMVVDVKHRENEVEAEELHVHPLARGFVDAADTTARTITVMGQTVQLTSATSFSDHRACLGASTPCTPIATAAGLATTTVSGTTTTPGSYVTVHGFLFGAATGTTGTPVQIVATLVAVSDPPTGSSPFNFKAEGVATVGTSTLTIGALTVDLSRARCQISGAQNDCTGFTTGKVVSAGAAAAPALPATLLVADVVRQANKVPVEVAGDKVEIEGVVSAVTGTSTFVVRGITVDISGLPAGTALPRVGDEVEVEGTLSANGDTVLATRLEIEHEAQEARIALQGDVTSVTPGATTGTFVVTVLGQAITVDAQTRLADMSVAGWDRKDPTSNPFNITTFQAVLAASVSKHVLVVAETTAAGTLHARSLALLPASSVVAVAGQVDATPAPVNSTVSGTPTVFFVHGIEVRADPAAVVHPAGKEGEDEGKGSSSRFVPTTVAAGDQVIVFGTLSGTGTIVVGPTLSATNRVVDVGALREDEDHDRGLF